MTTPINIEVLIEDIKNTATQVLNEDVTKLQGFAERQVEAIAQQAELVARGIASGGITEETRDYFLKSLEEMTLNFVKTLQGLLAATVEKVWNAIVGVVWRAIEAATGIKLPDLEP
jgi:hypothetical protein